MTVYAGLYSELLVINKAPTSGVAVTVYQSGTSTLATLYTSRLKTSTSPNPVTSDAQANLVFYAEPGSYDLLLNGRTVPVVVGNDPGETFGSVVAAELAVDAAFTGAYARLADPPTVPLRKFGAAYDEGDDITDLLQDAMDAVLSAGKGEVILIDKPTTEADPYLYEGSLLIRGLVRGVDREATFLKQGDTDATGYGIRSEWETGLQFPNVGLMDLTLMFGSQTQHLYALRGCPGWQLHRVNFIGWDVEPAAALGACIIGAFQTHVGANPACDNGRWSELDFTRCNNFGLQLGAVSGSQGWGLRGRSAYREVFGIEPGTWGPSTGLENQSVARGNIAKIIEVEQDVTWGDLSGSRTGAVILTESSLGLVEDNHVSGIVVRTKTIQAGDESPGVYVLGGRRNYVQAQVFNANGPGLKVGSTVYPTTDSVFDVAVFGSNQGANAEAVNNAGVSVAGTGTTRNKFRGVSRGSLATYGYAESSSATGNDVEMDLDGNVAPYLIGATSTIRGRVAPTGHALVGPLAIVGTTTLTGDLQVTAASGSRIFSLDAIAGQTPTFRLQTAGVRRWDFRRSATSEAGANAGSDLEIVPAADDGSALATALTITRATGLVGVAGALTVVGTATLGTVSTTGDMTLAATVGNRILSVQAPAGSVARLNLRTLTAERWIIQRNTTAEGGANAGSDLEILARTDAGGALFTALTITRSTARATFGGDIQVASTKNVDLLGGFLSLVEMTEPAAPSTNGGRIYLKDNGSGKTQLCVRFATGAVAVLATEP